MKKCVIATMLLLLVCMSAFGEAAEEEVLRLPSDLERIEAQAFAQCELVEVTMPTSVSYIAPDAFQGSTVERWDVVKDSYGWNWLVENGFITVTEDLTLYPLEEDPLPITATAEGLCWLHVDGSSWYDNYTWYVRPFGVIASGDWTVEATVDWISFEYPDPERCTRRTNAVDEVEYFEVYVMDNDTGASREGAILVTCGDTTMRVRVQQDPMNGEEQGY